jgi:hypothetical protein
MKTKVYRVDLTLEHVNSFFFHWILLKFNITNIKIVIGKKIDYKNIIKLLKKNAFRDYYHVYIQWPIAYNI